MNTFARFETFGHIGNITTVGKTLKIRVAHTFSRKNDRGEYDNTTRWNTYTIFKDSRAKWARENLRPGDLVRLEGEYFEDSYDKDGETIYGVTFACSQIDLLCPKAMRDLWNEHNRAA